MVVGAAVVVVVVVGAAVVVVVVVVVVVGLFEVFTTLITLESLIGSTFEV